MKRFLLLAAATLFGVAAFADWPHDVKWDQMQLDPGNVGGASYVDYDTPSDATSADDFLCTQPGYITDIEFAGFSYYGDSYIDKFRVQFFNDVPAIPGQMESHPGSILYSFEVGPADPNDPLKIGWYSPSEYLYKIDLPRDAWFEQHGTAVDPTVYWISIQGVMVTDGYYDAFYWMFRDPQYYWGDDAAFASDYFGYQPWAHWGIDDTNATVPYEGTLPAGWTSRDMAFKLTGTAVPEPASLVALGLGALALLRRRK